MKIPTFITKNPNLILILLFFMAVFQFFWESIRFEKYVFTKLGYEATTVLLTFLGIALFLRIFFRLSVNKLHFQLINFLIIPLFLATAIGMALAEAIYFKNIVFAHSGIHAAIFVKLARYSTLFYPVFFSFKGFKKFWRSHLFSLCIILFVATVFLKWDYPDLFNQLDSEDSVIEYATFLLYLFSAIITYKSLKLIKTTTKSPTLRKFQSVLLVTATLGLALIAGEEISWGQRLFNIQTPDKMLEINMQKEVSLHNIEGVFDYVYYAYLALGLYGILSPLLKLFNLKIFKHSLKQWFAPVLSSWFLIPYFIPMTAYVIWRYQSGLDGTYDPWEEFSEVFMATGVFLLFITNHYNKKFSTQK